VAARSFLRVVVDAPGYVVGWVTTCPVCRRVGGGRACGGGGGVVVVVVVVLVVVMVDAVYALGALDPPERKQLVNFKLLNGLLT
jgi:hypothetical protein